MNYTQYYRVAVISALLVTGVLAQDMMKMTTAGTGEANPMPDSATAKTENSASIFHGHLLMTAFVSIVSYLLFK